MSKKNEWTRRGALAALFTIMTSGSVSARRGSTPPVDTGLPDDIPGRGKGPGQRGPPDDAPGRGKGRRHRDPPQEYADPSALTVESIRHEGINRAQEYDEITFANGDADLPLRIGGWTVDVNPERDPVSIPEGTVIQPNDTYVLVLDQQPKMLNSEPGILYVYDDEGNEVGSWNYVGSPLSPNMPDI